MTKNRKPIPKHIREKVLEEYNHLCSICGKNKPHLHHIDEDPSNNNPLNLLPLCPNCHLIDQHAPTSHTDPEKLKLFRKYKDPVILSAQFHPVFLRFRFLININETSDIDEAEKNCSELVSFVAALNMGEFYSKQIKKLIDKPKHAGFAVIGDPADELRRKRQKEKDNKAYLVQLENSREDVQSLIVELLRYQNWKPANPALT